MGSDTLWILREKQRRSTFEKATFLCLESARLEQPCNHGVEGSTAPDPIQTPGTFFGPPTGEGSGLARQKACILLPNSIIHLILGSSRKALALFILERIQKTSLMKINGIALSMFQSLCVWFNEYYVVEKLLQVFGKATSLA